MIIGSFTYDHEKDVYSGMIATLTATRLRVIIRPVRKSGEREPDYRIEHLNDHDLVELGAAWKKSSERGAYLSIVLDDPMLPAPIYVALFHDERAQNSARLVWTRPTAKAAAAEPTRTEADVAPQPAPPGRARRPRARPAAML